MSHKPYFILDISSLLPRQIPHFPPNAGSQISLFNATLTAGSLWGGKPDARRYRYSLAFGGDLTS